MKKNLAVIGIIWLLLSGAANALDGQDQGQKPVSPLTQGSRPRAAAALGEGFWDDRFFEADGTNGSVNAIVINNGILYAGGSFTCIGGIAANSIAKWDGTTWSALGSGTTGFVYAMAISGTDLYVGGYFTTAGGVAANRIAKWNGSTWSPLNSGLDSSVRALSVFGADICAGGDFTRAGGLLCSSFAVWHRNLVLTSPVGGEI